MNKSPQEICPTHRLYGQKFSVEEMEFYIAHKDDLKICRNCIHWFKKQLENRVEEMKARGLKP